MLFGQTLYLLNVGPKVFLNVHIVALSQTLLSHLHIGQSLCEMCVNVELLVLESNKVRLHRSHVKHKLVSVSFGNKGVDEAYYSVYKIKLMLFVFLLTKD